MFDEAAALPGWNAQINSDTLTNELSQIGFNNPALSSSWVSLQSANATHFPALEDAFSVLLQGGLSATPTGFVASQASISQTGVVPPTSRSIRFEAVGINGSLRVSLGGQPINLYVISNSANFALYGGDVSGFAGQTTELRFTALTQSPPDLNDWIIDSIQFSDVAIPEPSVLGLLGSGAMVLGWRFRRGLRRCGR